VNGTTVVVKNTVQIDGSITAAVLKYDESLVVGRNQFKTVPAGTRLSFYKNDGPKTALTLQGLTVTKKISDQSYKLKTQQEISINCGRLNSAAAFVIFSETGELLSGCKSAVDQNIDSPLKKEDLTIHQGSSLYFFENGLLQGASSVSGLAQVGHNSIPIKPHTSLGFHENQRLHFFHPLEGSQFSFPTEIAHETEFQQPYAEQTFHVFLHPNQMISSAVLNLEFEFKAWFEAFGESISSTLKTGPVGFDQSGKINRLILSQKESIAVSKPTYLRRTEVNTGATVYGVYEVGARAALSKNSQIFLNTKGDSPVLESYPELGQQGLAFLFELSYEPF